MTRLLRSTTAISSFLDDPLLNHLSPLEKEKLREHSYYRTYAKGQILFDNGDARDRIYFLCSGLIRIESDDQEAEFTYIDYISGRQFFPYGGLFKDKSYRYGAEALTPIEVIYIPTTFFESFVKDNQNFLIDMYIHLSDVLYYHELRVRHTTTSSATDHVMQSLAIWCRDLGVTQDQDKRGIDYPLTIIELARMSGTTRETASRVVAQLKKEGKLSYRQKLFTFEDIPYFEKFLD